MNDSIYIDVGFETFLNRVFGRDRYYGLAGLRNKSKWKFILSKLFESLEKHFEENIKNDQNQVRELRKDIEIARSALLIDDSIDNININTIRALFEVCFQLLGDAIDNTDKKVVNKRQHYILDRKRTISYHIDNYQKYWQVHARAGTKSFLEADFPNKKELEDLFFDKMNKDPDKFFKWFKDEHPDLYISIF